MKSNLRGQTLVLFALTLMLLAVMVMMTIGLGVRIHERTEQQVVADAAAYSQAVVTARAYNSVASLNRVIIAQLSAVAAAQSLLSWAGFYHGTLNQARDLLAELAYNSPGCPSGVLVAAHDRITEEDRRLIDIWENPGPYGGVMGLDRKAANYIRRTLYGTALDVAVEQGVIYDRMMRDVAPAAGSGAPGIADKIALAARRGSPWRDEDRELWAGDQQITRRELRGAVVEKQRRPADMVRATMATRGVERFISSGEATWVAESKSAADYIRIRINKVMGFNPLVIQLTNYRTAYFGDEGPERDIGIAELEGYDGQAINRPWWMKWRDVKDRGEALLYKGAWAQDNGVFWFEWPGAPPGCDLPVPTEDSFGYIVTTGPDDDTDNHMWRRGNKGYGDYREWNDELGHVAPSQYPHLRHGFLRRPAGARPLSIWPVFVDYDADQLTGRDAAADMHGQPKHLVPIRRDYNVRTRDPWELDFTFQFSKGGSGQRLDLRANRPGLRRATAIGSGLTYYHRAGMNRSGQGHFAEPPNFLNPFWRATLAASDVDERYGRRGQDVIQTLRDINEDEAARTLRLLRQNGFEAMP